MTSSESSKKLSPRRGSLTLRRKSSSHSNTTASTSLRDSNLSQENNADDAGAGGNYTQTPQSLDGMVVLMEDITMDGEEFYDANNHDDDEGSFKSDLKMC